MPLPITYLYQFIQFKSLPYFKSHIKSHVHFFIKSIRFQEFVTELIRQKMTSTARTTNFVPHIGQWRFKINGEFRYWINYLQTQTFFPEVPTIIPLYAATPHPKSIIFTQNSLKKVRGRYNYRIDFFPNGVCSIKKSFQGLDSTTHRPPTAFVGMLEPLVMKSLFLRNHDLKLGITQAWRIIYTNDHTFLDQHNVFKRARSQKTEKIDVGIGEQIQLVYYPQLRTIFVFFTELTQKTRLKLRHVLDLSLMQFLTFSSYIQHFKEELINQYYNAETLAENLRFLFWFYHPDVYGYYPQDLPKLFPLAWQRKVYDHLSNFFSYKKKFDALYLTFFDELKKNSARTRAIGRFFSKKMSALLSPQLEVNPLDEIKLLDPLEKRVLKFLIDSYLADKKSRYLMENEWGYRNRHQIVQALQLNQKAVYAEKFGEYPPFIEKLIKLDFVIAERIKFKGKQELPYYRIRLSNEIIKTLLEDELLRNDLLNVPLEKKKGKRHKIK